MTTGADSMVVNGQLLAFPTTASYQPQGYGPQTVGVPQVTPSYPPYVGAPTQTAPGAEGIGGYGTAGNNQMAAAYANANPWSLKGSPVIWAVGGLVGALLLLKAVHWRETMLAGDESARVGPVSERAEASA